MNQAQTAYDNETPADVCPGCGETKTGTGKYCRDCRESLRFDWNNEGRE
jgi:tRNA(Ile2) C34 agmatinyltransferase TiaS